MEERLEKLEYKLSRSQKFTDDKDFIITLDLVYSDNKLTYRFMKRYFLDGIIKKVVIRENLTVEQAVDYLEFYFSMIEN